MNFFKTICYSALFLSLTACGGDDTNDAAKKEDEEPAKRVKVVFEPDMNLPAGKIKSGMSLENIEKVLLKEMGLKPSKIDTTNQDARCPENQIRILKFDVEDTLFQLQFQCGDHGRNTVLVAMHQFSKVPDDEKEMWARRNKTAAELAEKAVRIIGAQEGREFFETTTGYENAKVTANYLVPGEQDFPNGAKFWGNCDDRAYICTFTYNFEK